MAMQIDQAWHQYVPVQRKFARCGKAIAGFSLGHDGNNPALMDGNSMMLECRVSRLHWNDPAGTNQQVYGFSHES